MSDIVYNIVNKYSILVCQCDNSCLLVIYFIKLILTLCTNTIITLNITKPLYSYQLLLTA